ncbi:MAG: GAF and ANTAR domain-containing protein [bacterium]
MSKIKNNTKKLRTKLRRLDQELNFLRKVSETIISSGYLDDILQLIITMTAAVMNSRICSLMLLNESNDHLEIKATQSLSEDYINKPPVKVGAGISGKAVKTRKPIVVLDVTKSKAYRFPDIAKKEGCKSLLCVPMLIKDRCIGVINSYTSKEHKFTKEEIKLLQTVANQAAVAIENASLLSRALSLENALETRKIVEKAKGLIMKKDNMGEDEAFKSLQRKAMNSRKSMKEIAEMVLVSYNS